MPRRRRLVASKSSRDDEEQRCNDAGGGMAPSVEATEAVLRRVGHPETGALIQSAKNPPSSLYVGYTPVRNTREMSRNISRGSSILVNSPDPVSKRLVF